MQKRLLPMLIVLCAVLLTGCSQERMIRWVTTPEERSEAIRFIEAVRTGDRAFLESRSAAETWRGTAPMLAEARTIFAPGQVRWRVAGVHRHTLYQGPTTTVMKQIVLEGAGSGRWYLAAVVTRQVEGRARVVAWNVTPFATPPGAEHAFTLAGKSPLHWLWLLLCIAMPLVCAAAIVSIWRGPRIRLRPLWTVGCLFGFVGFTMNWTTGETMVFPISFHVPSARVGQPNPYAPWFLTFAIPVFALLYFALRKRLRASAEAKAPPPANPV